MNNKKIALIIVGALVAIGGITAATAPPTVQDGGGLLVEGGKVPVSDKVGGSLEKPEVDTDGLVEGPSTVPTIKPGEDPYPDDKEVVPEVEDKVEEETEEGSTGGTNTGGNVKPGPVPRPDIDGTNEGTEQTKPSKPAPEVGEGVAPPVYQGKAKVTMTRVSGFEAATAGSNSRDVRPIITVNKDNFLIEKNSPFNFAAELGIKVDDGTGVDITDTLTVPDFNPIETGKVFYKIEATNAKGATSTRTMTLNVFEVPEAKVLATPREVEQLTPSAIVESHSDVKSEIVKVDEKTSTVTVKISDGKNTVEKKIKAVTPQGEPTFAKTNSTVNTTSKPKPEAPKPTVPKPETPKPEAPKPTVPKPEAPKPETPKPEVSNPGTNTGEDKEDTNTGEDKEDTNTDGYKEDTGTNEDINTEGDKEDTNANGGTTGEETESDVDGSEDTNGKPSPENNGGSTSGVLPHTGDTPPMGVAIPLAIVSLGLMVKAMRKK